MKCESGSCTRKALIGPYCKHHHRYLRKLNLVGYADAVSSLDHLAKLHAVGWDNGMIAEEAGISRSTLQGVVNRGGGFVRIATQEAILSVEVRPVDGRRTVKSLGAIRRAQGLMRMGWTRAHIAEAGGIRADALDQMLCRGSASATLDHALKRAAARLGDRRGPSKATATKASNRGYLPLLAWDDIDGDPSPADQKATPRTSQDIYEEYQHMHGLGVSDGVIARSLGIKPAALERAVYRAKKIESQERMSA